MGWLDRRGGGLDGGRDGDDRGLRWSRGVGSGGGGGSGKLDGEMKGDDEISMGDDRLVGGHRWMTAGGV